MKIKKLRFDVRSKLESGLVLTDATQCAMELVENALDAKCTAVAVRINLKDYSIEVVDNGIGISPDDLQLVGKRFMTSKLQNTNDLNKKMTTFGFRGQALASIIDVSSKLIIRTKSKLSSKTMVKVFTNGRSPSVSICSKEKCGTGTIVAVYDFMCTMPVRQKRITEIFDIQEIKNQLEYLALIHNEVSFTLRDENKGEIILESQSRRNAGFSFADLFGMALGKFLVPINYREEKIEIEGFIGLQRHSENNLQFFYVNKRIISRSVTHKFLNALIDRYLNENEGSIEESPIWQGINFKMGKNFHNVYLVQIQCPHSNYQIFRNLRKTTVEFKNWDQIFHCLKSAIKTVLGTEILYTIDDRIIRKRKNENIKDFPAKGGDVEFDRLKCGITGVLVNRKQLQFVLSDKKSLSNHVTFVQKENFNDKKRVSLIEEMKNNIPKLMRPAAFDCRETMNPTPEEVKTPLKYEVKQKRFALNEEGTIKNDFLIDFAIWLKSKMENDGSLRKIYREFVNQKLILCNMKKLKAEKRKREVFNEKEEIEGNCGKMKKVCNQLKTGEFSMSPPNLNLNYAQVGCEKKESPSLLFESLKITSEEFNGKRIKKLKTVNENDMIKISFSIGTNDFTERDIEQLISGNSDVLNRGESSKSWVSHKNRGTWNKKYYIENSRIASHKARKCRFFTYKKNKDENVGVGSLDTLTNRHLKWLEGHREIEVQTSIENCDKGIQIDSSGIGDHVHNISSKTGEYDANIIIEASDSRVNNNNNNNGSMEEEFAENYVDDGNRINPLFSPKLSNCKCFDPFFPTECYKKPKSQNLADTLSLGDTENGNGASPFTFVNRYTFIPKGLSPTVLDRSLKSTHNEITERTWNGESTELFTKSLLPEEFVEELKEKTVENMIYYESEVIKSYMTKTECKINSSINSFEIDKRLLSNVEVIGQWDKKFIIGKTRPMLPEEKHILILFDQHAVDERIQLEKLLKELRDAEGKFISTNCNPPLKCKMKESTLRLIPSLDTILLNFGIKVSVLDSEHALFREIPACFFQHNGDKAEIFLENILNDVIGEFNETRGSGSTIPRVMYTMISTRACKSAVKFNESLSLDEMARMVNDLLLCQIPFQCAHGRPSLVPLLDLEAFENQNKKMEENLNFKKFRKMKAE